MTQTPIRILVVEDSEADFELLSLSLARLDFPVQLERVESEPEMRRALKATKPDLVISDNQLPVFSLRAARRVLREHDSDIPLVVVSGAIGEEAAVDAMLEGADDVIMKSNLARLAPAITRTVRAADSRRRQRLAEAALYERESTLRSLAANLPATVLRLALDRSTGRLSLPYVGEGSQRMFGVDPARLRVDPGPLLQAIAAEDRAVLVEHLAAAAAAGTDLRWQGRLAADSESGKRWLQLSATRGESDGDGASWDGLIYDITDIKRAESEIRSLTSHLERVKETERAAAAREIHDDIGAIFFGLKVDLAWLKKRLGHEPALLRRIADAETQLDSGVQASQRIVRSLHPPVLDFGLIGAIEWLAKDFGARTGIRCKFEPTMDEPVLAPELGTAAFRVTQESLTNVSRHAMADEVTIRMTVEGGSLVLEVIDNGRGIATSDLVKSTSFGVRGMRERATQHGGTFVIGSREGGGTRLTFRVPLATSPAEMRI